MRFNTGGLFRILAVTVIVFFGIAVVTPQNTQRDDESVMPVWNDMTEQNSQYINTVIKNGLMSNVGDSFGVDMAFTATEGAYAAVKLYEAQNGIESAFDKYIAENGVYYTDKAAEYGLWRDTIPTGDTHLTREQVAAIFAPLTDEAAETKVETFSQMDRFAYPTEVLKLYNLGITIDRRITSAFSPDIEVTRGEAAQLIAMCIDKSLRCDTADVDYSGLKSVLADTMAAYPGDWSLYFEDYGSGACFSINSHQVYSASLIKMFVAEAAYKKMSEGGISDIARTEDEIRKMLTYSDNEAWKYIAKALGGGSYSGGMAYVTDLAQSEGFAATGQFYQGSHKNFNFTSVEDCGRFLSRVLDGTIISREYSDKILAYLKQQQHRQKLPSGVPEGVETANKTGELEYVQGDAAVVYAPSGTYILTVIGDSLNNAYGEVPKFTDISKTVYEYLNK